MVIGVVVGGGGFNDTDFDKNGTQTHHDKLNDDPVCFFSFF
jgi:hypothetical protein